MHFAGYAKHVGFYPTGSGIEGFKEELKPYKSGKGTRSTRNIACASTSPRSRSLRTHLANDVQGWVQDLLDGCLDAAAAHSDATDKQGFRLYLTRDLQQAIGYVRERYSSEQDKRYGFLGSSKGRLDPFGIPTDYYATQRMRIGPWYYDDPDSVHSCCRLDSAATEFQCQGLELDLPIVGWGADLHWNGRNWQSPPQRRSQAHDPHKLRLNSYRVLLTRGRDGLVLYIPDGGPDFDSDYLALQQAGGRSL